MRNARPLTRRELLANAGAFVPFLGGLPGMIPTDPRGIVAGPLVVLDGATQARAWIAAASGKSRVELLLATAKKRERRLAFPEQGSARSSILLLDELLPQTRYTYRIIVDGDEAHDVSGEFVTAPKGPFRGRIAATSCTNPASHPAQVAWTRLMEGHPLAILHLGDTMYENTTNLERWLRATFQQRQVPEFREALRRVPIWAIWDDHDYGRNDGDGTLPGKESSLKQFKALWPNPGAGLDDVEGVFFKTSYGDVDLFFLDTRYHRHPNTARDDSNKRMLGEPQFAWLERGLTESKARFKFVCSGSTLWASSADGWRRYSEDRRRLIGLTKRVPGIVYVTGDIHVSRIERRDYPRDMTGYPIYELICSGMATRTEYDAHWWMEIELDTTKKDPTLSATVRCFDSPGVRELPLEPNELKSRREAMSTFQKSCTIAASELQIRR